MAGLQEGPVETCSISFGDPRFNESTYAASIAQRFGTNHHVEQVDSDDFDLIDTLVAAYDEPFADSSALPTYRVCQLARKHVTVALSGDAGDENFAGYRRYRWHMHEERLRRLLPQSVRGPLFGLAGALYPKLDWAPQWLRAKTTFEALARTSMAAYFHSVSVMPDRVRLPLYNSSFRRELGGYHALEVFRKHVDGAPADDALSFIQYLDLKTWLPGDILTKVDRASMQHALEVRVPLLDHTLVEWIGGLPSAASWVSITVVAWLTCGFAVVITRVAFERRGAFVIRASACSARSSAFFGRPPGFLTRQDITSAATSAETSVGRGGGASLICDIAIAIWVSPVNGRLPFSAS
jgi:asparagine synthase (glutamine-hydrolysing)